MSDTSRTIVVAIDDSDLAPVVLGRAVASSAPDDDLHVVHVFQPPWTALTDMGTLVDVGAMEEEVRRRVWARVVNDLPDQARRVDLRGPAAHTIALYAGDVQADLIVIGNRGHSPIASLVLGSTSHGVIHDADCDVLVVRTA